jgi:hypothetical protein
MTILETFEITFFYATNDLAKTSTKNHHCRYATPLETVISDSTLYSTNNWSIRLHDIGSTFPWLDCSMSALNLFMNTILICKCCSQIFELCHTIFMRCLCPAFWHLDTNIYLVFSGFRNSILNNATTTFLYIISNSSYIISHHSKLYGLSYWHYR